MAIDPEQPRLSDRAQRPRAPALGFLGKLAAAAAGVVVLVAALVFSLVLVAVVAGVGVVAWAYLWWRTRDLRRQLRERQREQPRNGTVIEGEFSRAPRSQDDTDP